MLYEEKSLNNEHLEWLGVGDGRDSDEHPLGFLAMEEGVRPYPMTLTYSMLKQVTTADRLAREISKPNHVL